MKIIILIYVLSIIGAYLFVQKSYYDPKGVFKGKKDPDLTDLFVTFMPGINTGFSIIFILGGWKDKKYREINFFKPKDKL